MTDPKEMLIDAADGIAEDLLHEAKLGHFESDTELYERMWETVDSHECVIYTYKAKLLCVVADWESIIETYGLSASSIKPEVLAFYTLMEEVQSHPDYDEAVEVIETHEQEEL